MWRDFSGNADLVPLARVANALRVAAVPPGIGFFLMGAAARELMMRFAHGIDTSRATHDADFAVMVRDWAAYEGLHAALVSSGEFIAQPGPALHRLRHSGGLAVDIVPFGGIERADRTYTWPPAHTTVFDCFGVNEAFAASVEVRLPEGVPLKVAPIPALAILKICAWNDRKHTAPGQDAPDLLLFLRHYLDCGSLDRAFADHADLFEAEDFDYAEAGARLLARDILPLAGKEGIGRLTRILAPEAGANGALLLARQSGYEPEAARRLLEAFCDELASSAE